MEDVGIHKVAIPGPTMASLIQRFYTSPNAIDGLLFGYVSHSRNNTLHDETSSSSAAATAESDPPDALIATITGVFCSGTINSFYDSAGQVNPSALQRLVSAQPRHSSLIGWFSGRRKSELRPSMREFAVSESLSSMTQFAFPVKDAEIQTNLTPSVFLLFGSPLAENLILTHDYRGYQFRSKTASWERKTVNIVNIGPAFRGNYGSFSPNSPLPALALDFGGSRISKNHRDDNISTQKQLAKDQKELDLCAEGFDLGKLSFLLGSQSKSYTAGVEELYAKMLVKMEIWTRQVEMSSAKVFEQESYNRKLRHKISRTAVSE